MSYGYGPPGGYNNYYNYGQPSYGMVQPPSYYNNVPSYNNVQRQGYYGAYPPPPQYARNQNPPQNTNNYNNNNIPAKTVQSQQSLALNDAITRASYPKYREEVILNLILYNFDGNNEAKVYLMSKEKDKTFVAEYIFNIALPGGKKSYKINVLMHIPLYYPDDAPEFYIEKRKGVGLSNSYKNGKIDPRTFKINIDKFAKFDPQRNNINEIIYAIKRNFNQDFPIFSDKNDNVPEIPGKNNINKNQVNEVIIKTQNFKNDAHFLSYMKQQVKDVIRGKYDDFRQKYKINEDNQELQNISRAVKMKSGGNIRNNPMNQNLEKLKTIKNILNQKESELRQDLQNLESGSKTFFDKVDEIVSVKDEEYMEYAVKKKVMEDYLIYLKKGYEKKMVNFHDMINQTRTFSRDIFTISYLMKKKEKEKS